MLILLELREENKEILQRMIHEINSPKTQHSPSFHFLCIVRLQIQKKQWTWKTRWRIDCKSIKAKVEIFHWTGMKNTWT